MTTKRTTKSAAPARKPRALKGRQDPRVGTEPLRKLTRRTSRGYEVCDFAEQVLGEPLLPWQRRLVIRALELNPDGSYRFRVILSLVARQNGKALDTETPILTTAGWSTMGALQVGDEVFHPDGEPVQVVDAHPVMHDHACYRVTTTDGRAVVADAEHLWTVQDRRRCTSKGRRGERQTRTYEWETLSTDELLGRGLRRGSRECAFRLPRQQVVQSPDVELPIDPYLLGAWLGDGHSRASALAVGDEDLAEMTALIESAGARIVSQKRGRTVWRVGFALDAEMRDGFQSRALRLGVWGEKHIPEMYLTAGTDQRLALLQGLLDTDGSITQSAGQVEFTTSNRALADGVLYLVRSLGRRTSLKDHPATLGGVEVGRKYRVMFSPDSSEPIPFRLARKAARVKDRQSRGGERHAVSIRSIEPVESRPVRCIRVDRADGLFLAGRDLMPTHNTHLLRVLTLWRLYVDGARLALGVAQDVSLAREVWQACIDSIKAVPDLSAELDTVRRVNGDEWFRLASGSRYKIGAANRSAGRGLSVDQLNMDEIREQRSWDAWSALSKTTMARSLGMIWAISNAGDDRSIVLNHLRDAALSGRDPSIGLFEWSAPEGCELDDPKAWAAANPGLGYTVSEQAIRSAMATDPPEVFRTEVLCQRVDSLNGAFDVSAWKAGADPAGSLATVRDRVIACLDVAPDGRHATLAGAAILEDGRARVEAFAAWRDTDHARRELPELLERIAPAALAFFPAGPAAGMAADLRALGGRIRDEGAVEIKGGGITEACMGLAELVAARRVLHPSDPLLDTHVAGASKLATGDGWRYTRNGVGHCDGAYAVAGAVHVARTLPVETPKPRSAVF